MKTMLKKILLATVVLCSSSTLWSTCEFLEMLDAGYSLAECLEKYSPTDINFSCPECVSALFIAAEHNNLPLVKELLDAGARTVNYGGIFEATPLDAAVTHRNLKMVYYFTPYANATNVTQALRGAHNQLTFAKAAHNVYSRLILAEAFPGKEKSRISNLNAIIAILEARLKTLSEEHATS